MDAGLAATRSEARRSVDQKGVRLDGTILEDAQVPFLVGRPAGWQAAVCEDRLRGI